MSGNSKDPIEMWLKEYEKDWLSDGQQEKIIALVRVYRKANRHYCQLKTYERVNPDMIASNNAYDWTDSEAQIAKKAEERAKIIVEGK
jgi:hypothetical protein